MPTPKKANRTKQRSQIGLDAQLDKNLRSYETAARATSNRSLTASAAIAVVGFGIFAAPQETLAEVVFTPVHQSLMGPQRYFPFDLNNDGTPDVSVTVYNYVVSGSGGAKFGFNALSARGLQAGNEIAAKGQFAYAGRGGQRLGSSAEFSNRPIMGFDRFASGKPTTYSGQWTNIQSRRFLGVKFLISGEVHFGWIRFSSAHVSPAGAHAVVTGYAYETIPNKPIIAGLGSDGLPAPDPLSAPVKGSLGHLAAGAAGR